MRTTYAIITYLRFGSDGHGMEQLLTFDNIMNIRRISIEKIELNTGQIEGLPANPRQWTRDDIDRIAASLKETPELFEMRPCIVYPHEGKYVLLAGNLRFCGARQNGDKDVPCCVVKADTPVEKLKEIVLKDNGSWGAWDFDELANKWDDLPLTDWGVPAWGATIIEDIDGLYVEAPATEKKDDLKITIEVPKGYADKLEDIKASLRLTLDEWQGCKVK